MARDRRKIRRPADEARRDPLGVYTPEPGVGPDDVPTDLFRPRAKPHKPQAGNEA